MTTATTTATSSAATRQPLHGTLTAYSLRDVGGALALAPSERGPLCALQPPPQRVLTRLRFATNAAARKARGRPSRVASVRHASRTPLARLEPAHLVCSFQSVWACCRSSSTRFDARDTAYQRRFSVKLFRTSWLVSTAPAATPLCLRLTCPLSDRKRRSRHGTHRQRQDCSVLAPAAAPLTMP